MQDAACPSLAWIIKQTTARLSGKAEAFQVAEYRWKDDIHFSISPFRPLITKTQYVQDKGHLYAPSALSLTFPPACCSSWTAADSIPPDSAGNGTSYGTNQHPLPHILVSSFWVLDLAHEALEPVGVSEHWGSLWALGFLTVCAFEQEWCYFIVTAKPRTWDLHDFLVFCTAWTSKLSKPRIMQVPSCFPSAEMLWRPKSSP